MALKSTWAGFLYVPNRTCGREGAANLCLVLTEKRIWLEHDIRITPRSCKVKIASVLHL